MNNDIVIFKNGELELEVSVSEDRETVWLSQKQMSQLFKVSTDNVTPPKLMTGTVHGSHQHSQKVLRKLPTQICQVEFD